MRISESESEYRVVSIHHHPPNYGDCKAQLAIGDIKQRAREEPNVHPLHLTQNILTGVDSETLIALPKEKSLKRCIQRVRRENQPPLPRTFEELGEIPEQYSMVHGENWVLFDNREEEPDNRVLVLSRRETIRHMSRSSQLFGDGTFECVPRLLTQLYVVHYTFKDNVLLGPVALMKRKNERSYTILFQAIRQAFPDDQQNWRGRFSSDFELAASNAFRTVFPDSTEQFCYFHFAQLLWRKAQNVGIAEPYKEEDEVELRTQFHAILAIAYVPPDHVQEAFMDLREAADERLDGILDLLEDNYIMGRRRGRGRTAPRFPVASWSVFQATLENRPRTNNNSEAWNRRWKALVGKSHPNIYSMLEKLKKEVEYSDAQRELAELGNPSPMKKTKYVENDQRLQRLVRSFDEIIGTVSDDPWRSRYLQFLRTVGHSARGFLD